MDTVLNLGLNDTTVEALAKKSGDRRFAFDSYRRFVQMYSDVVLGIELHHFEKHLERAKEKRGIKQERVRMGVMLCLEVKISQTQSIPKRLFESVCRTASCFQKTWRSW